MCRLIHMLLQVRPPLGNLRAKLLLLGFYSQQVAAQTEDQERKRKAIITRSLMGFGHGRCTQNDSHLFQMA